MKRKLLSILGILIFIGTFAYAQTRTISGKVIGKDDGLPLPGVSVKVQGASTATQTGSDGSYSIRLGSGQRLTFSFMGFDSQTLTPNENGILNVTLDGASTSLNDVVVIGYGTQVKRDNIGSIGSIKGNEIAQQPVQNIQQSLGGRVSGAQVSIPSGLLNATPVIRIRGTNSISFNSQPLYVVDGVPSYSNEAGGSAAQANPLSSINPDDIESVDIAKDAAATAIYGSRAANGVVFITTKKGKKGKAVVSLESWVGISKNFNLPELLNATQYTDIKNEALRNSRIYNDNPATPAANLFYATSVDANGQLIDTKWLDYIYRTGTSYNTSASISGANDFTNYYVSANYSNQQGLLQGNDFKRKGFLANVDHKISKYVTAGAKIQYTNSQNFAATTSGSVNDAFAISGLGRVGLVLPPNISPYNNDGSYNLNGNTLGLGANKGIGIGYYNILPILDLNRSNNELNQIASNVYLQVKPLPGLTFKTQYGIDYVFRDNDIYSNPIQGDGNPNASATGVYSKRKSWVWSNTLQYDHTFAEKHNLSLLAGNEQNGFATRGFGINRTVISDPAFDVIQAGFSTNLPSGMAYTDAYIASFFGRVNYDYDKKYYLSATLRQDEASQFGNENKRGYFPGAAVAWEIAREGFWKNISADRIFSSFKLRASYGKVGNNSLGAYDSYGLYASGLYNGGGTLYFDQTGNPNLQWENIKTLDIGANFGVLNNKVTAEVTYYKKNIDDLILQVPVAPSSGLPSFPTVNIGSMFNRGVEVTLNAQAITTNNFSWSPSFNISFNRNEVTSLSEGVTRLTTATSGSETTNITEVGHPIGNLYIVRTEGVDAQTGRRIFLDAQNRRVLYQHVLPLVNGVPTGFQWEYTDGTRAPAITQSADAVNYKQTAPKAYGGFSNNFTFKNFDLNVLLTYQLGGWTYYGTNAGIRDQRFWNNSTDILDRWTTPGQVTNIPKLYANDNVSNGSSLPISENVFRSDFLKIKSLSFGYTLPQSVVSGLGISNLRFYVSGFNLVTFSGYPGPDPEVSSNGAGNEGNAAQGVDRNTAGNQRTMTAGLSVKF